MDTPKVRYTTNNDVSIAYQVVGEGEVDLITALGSITHLEVLWEEPRCVEFLRRLSSFTRLILFDKRGMGLSDRVTRASSLEERMDDLRAVCDAVGSKRSVVFGASEGGPMSVLYAATFPDRTTALVVYGSMVCGRYFGSDPYKRSARNPFDATALAAEDARIRDHWGEPISLDGMAPTLAHDPEFKAWFSKLRRFGATPSSVSALRAMNSDIDVRDVLSSIRVPTLVLHRRGDRDTPFINGQYLAEHIPDAKFVELSGIDHLPFVGDMDSVVGEIEEFVTGARAAPTADRVLTTVVFTDIVSSTARSVALGDEAWRKDLEALYRSSRQEIDHFRGREVKTLGDGILATFDGPARAVRSALALVELAESQGLQLRAGVHTGEVELVSGDVLGMAVNLCQRVQSEALPGEVLVTSTVRDLVAGSGLRFEDRGARSLKGIPEPWRVYVATGDDQAR
ncbi:MAG TPA: adenylate/guanylate cyclase domain-containing protein [Acidimicrobiales bacterium]|nr:adenylate/guanylate cyclase domain-containing protein [Acidimicrobiales bacterium]